MAKEPWEWEEEDLELLISTKTQESISLDYKSSADLQNTDGKKNEISRDVSAFANSAGGVLVYGITENKQSREPIAIDIGCDPAVITKEWLDQVINSRIQQRIDGVRVKQVPLPNTHPGQVAYVVYVPQSNRAPHQASDKRFYKRFNFESQPMEEYEVRDVSRRLETPQLRIRLTLEGQHHIASERQRRFVQTNVSALISNHAVEPATHAMIYLYFDPRITLIGVGGRFTAREVDVRHAGRTWPMKVIQRTWKPPEDMPIFQHEDFSVGAFLMHIPILHVRGQVSYLLGWKIAGPRMDVRDGYTILDVIDESLSMRDEQMKLDDVLQSGVLGQE